MKFKVIIKKGEDGYFVATVPSLPGCISQGKTEAEAKENIKEAIELHLECLAEDGIPLSPKQNGTVTEVQVNI
ncbi:MAG TPA: type II toxin-antitoxin system HicB family antitoxin [archaeon]|nr:type II toxin-antitoxin system HicB family antitoxin [archaeon]